MTVVEILLVVVVVVLGLLRFASFIDRHMGPDDPR